MAHFWVSGTTYSDSARISSSTAAEARKASTSVRQLEEQVDKLTLICHAMWELLRDRAKMSDTDLIAKVQEFDLRDGMPDGKKTKTVSQCPECSRTMSPKHCKCLYCGYEKLVSSAFDGL